MNVILADTVVTVQGWERRFDYIGQYTLKIRKTPEEMREEKKRRREEGRPLTVKNMKFSDRNIIWHDKRDTSVAYFLPGQWPRVRGALDAAGVQYTIDDQRNSEIRPPIQYDKLEGVDFRKNQDIALALIATADCGVIETSTAWGLCRHPCSVSCIE